MRHEAEIRGEHRNRGVHARSAAARRCVGATRTTIGGASGFARRMSWEAAVFKNLWVIVFVLPVVIAALAVAIEVLGVMVRLFPH